MLVWEVEFDAQAEDDLASLNTALRSRVIEKITWLKVNFDVVTPLPLTADWYGFYKLRIGDWRVIYDIDWEQRIITIVLIGHHTKVYKHL
ncbi:MAG: type II toxin-antitoxin system RelE/ParE family toxin [Candidatus Vogelbacteria bacterium]|nr:type II toxin-antitoxin system RelE/ParE family toxin [Candidatus Vogelbacteria bacterium]